MPRERLLQLSACLRPFSFQNQIVALIEIGIRNRSKLAAKVA